MITRKQTMMNVDWEPSDTQLSKLMKEVATEALVKANKSKLQLNAAIAKLISNNTTKPY